MTRGPISRRRFLVLGTAALASGLLGRARARPEGRLRIGVILERRTGRPILSARSQALAAGAALQGAILAGEGYAGPGHPLEGRVDVLPAEAPDASAAVRAADRLVAREGVAALLGGLGPGHGPALAEVAERRGVPFLHLGAATEVASRDASTTFRVDASREAYAEAAASRLVAEGRRSWFVVHGDDGAGEATLAALRRAGRRSGPREAGATAVATGTRDVAGALAGIERTRPDAILLALPWVAQLDVLEAFEAADVRGPVLALPDPSSQTREFYRTVRDRAPRLGRGPRIALWDPAIDAPEARASAERFRERFGAPMDAPAWAAHRAVGMAIDVAAEAGEASAEAVLVGLAGPTARPATGEEGRGGFDPRSRYLETPLYVVEIDAVARRADDLVRVLGEVPPRLGG